MKEVKSTWYLYILLCRDGSYYTGITTDIARRVEMHNTGKGARYTNGRCPVRLVHREECRDRGDALRREHAVKQLTKEGKREYVREHGSSKV